MNQTEAWEAVYNAALERLSWQVLRAKTRAQKAECKTLERALRKVGTRVHRMRSRLEFARARKAGTLNRPSWATP